MVWARRTKKKRPPPDLSHLDGMSRVELTEESKVWSRGNPQVQADSASVLSPSAFIYGSTISTLADEAACPKCGEVVTEFRGYTVRVGPETYASGRLCTSCAGRWLRQAKKDMG